MLKLKQAGFLIFAGLVLTGLCWLGSVGSVTALPLIIEPSTAISTAPTVEIAMASKPLFSFSGNQPTNLGVKDGKLASCPNTPNCVNSQAPDGDAEHKIAPLAYKSAPSDLMAVLKSVITSMERTKIITETNDYLYVEFASALMGFVDDVEFYLDPSTPGQLQMRSASRLGQSDLGVNRKRIEEIRAKLAQAEG
jgi:uncharacterized protein (DUF1499 family)